MKKILILCILTLAAVTAMVWRAVARPSLYGNFAGAPKAEVAALVADPTAYLHKTVEIEGAISDQCKAMGCFFFFRSPKGPLRVDLQEIAMTAPMREGHTARVEGEMVPFNGGYQFYASAIEFK